MEQTSTLAVTPEQTPALQPAAYEYTRANGTVERADSVAEAMSRCTGFLGKMSLKDAALFLELEATGNELIKAETAAEPSAEPRPRKAAEKPVSVPAAKTETRTPRPAPGPAVLPKSPSTSDGIAAELPVPLTPPRSSTMSAGEIIPTTVDQQRTEPAPLAVPDTDAKIPAISSLQRLLQPDNKIPDTVTTINRPEAGIVEHEPDITTHEPVELTKLSTKPVTLPTRPERIVHTIPENPLLPVETAVTMVLPAASTATVMHQNQPIEAPLQPENPISGETIETIKGIEATEASRIFEPIPVVSLGEPTDVTVSARPAPNEQAQLPELATADPELAPRLPPTDEMIDQSVVSLEAEPTDFEQQIDDVLTLLQSRVEDQEADRNDDVTPPETPEPLVVEITDTVAERSVIPGTLPIVKPESGELAEMLGIQHDQTEQTSDVISFSAYFERYAETMAAPLETVADSQTLDDDVAPPEITVATTEVASTAISIEKPAEKPLEEQLAAIIVCLKAVPNEQDLTGDKENETFEETLSISTEHDAVELQATTAALLAVQDRVPAEELPYSRELATQLIQLLRLVGYEDPQHALRDFMTRYDLEFLLQAVAVLQALTQPDNRHEFMIAGLRRIRNVADNAAAALAGRIGQAILGRIKPLVVV